MASGEDCGNSDKTPTPAVPSVSSPCGSEHVVSGYCLDCFHKSRFPWTEECSLSPTSTSGLVEGVGRLDGSAPGDGPYTQVPSISLLHQPPVSKVCSSPHSKSTPQPMGQKKEEGKHVPQKTPRISTYIPLATMARPICS